MSEMYIRFEKRFVVSFYNSKGKNVGFLVFLLASLAAILDSFHQLFDILITLNSVLFNLLYFIQGI